MPFLEVQPDSRLASLIHCFTAVERVFTPEHNTFSILPDSRVEVVFNLGMPCSIVDGSNERPLGACYVVGLLRQPITLRALGRVCAIRTSFYPWGWAQFAGELRPAAVNVEESDDKDAREDMPAAARVPAELIAQLRGAYEQAGASAAIPLLQAFLVQHLHTARPEQALMQSAASSILDAGGNTRIYAVARQHAVSERTLNRAFTRQIGVSPKQLASVKQFDGVRDALWGNPSSSLAEIALYAGYADQAHMQREFKRHSGLTPHQFAQAMREMRAEFAAEPVRNLQYRADGQA